MPEITTITSEALQAEVRRLLPSQRGFGGELEAQNVIVPIIDLTPTAEGSILRNDLQSAYSFGNTTSHYVRNTTTTLVNSPGFFRISGAVNIEQSGSSRTMEFNISNGLASKFVWGIAATTATGELITTPIDFTVFIAPGESFECEAGADINFYGSSLPLADVNGNLINPAGFTFE